MFKIFLNPGRILEENVSLTDSSGLRNPERIQDRKLVLSCEGNFCLIIVNPETKNCLLFILVHSNDMHDN